MDYAAVYPMIYHAGNYVRQVSVSFREVLQMVGEVEGLEEPSVQWRREGRVGRELKRLRQRVQKILDDWLDCYRMAIGITQPFWGLRLLKVCTCVCMVQIKL